MLPQACIPFRPGSSVREVFLRSRLAGREGPPIEDCHAGLRSIRSIRPTRSTRSPPPLIPHVSRQPSPSPNRQPTVNGATKSWTYGESPVVLLSVRIHRHRVLTSLFERRARNQHDRAVRLQHVASEVL